MKITINGTESEVRRVFNGGYLVCVDLDDGTDWYLAEDSETAGKAARKYWVDMAENDPKEFECIVGGKNLIAWALGRYAGPGNEHVKSLQEWFDLCAEHPEEEFASYDGTECDVESADEELIEELGFTPTVAYRHN